MFNFDSKLHNVIQARLKLLYTTKKFTGSNLEKHKGCQFPTLVIKTILEINCLVYLMLQLPEIKLVLRLIIMQAQKNMNHQMHPNMNHARQK